MFFLSSRIALLFCSFCTHTHKHILSDACTLTWTQAHYPFLRNWKDALAVCHTAKVDQMAEYPWGSTSPTGRIKEKNLSLSHSTPLSLPLTVPAFHRLPLIHTLTESQTQWIRLTAPFLISQLPPLFVPVLYYNMNGPVKVELDHLSCVNFFLHDTRTRKWFLSSSIQSEASEMKADCRKYLEKSYNASVFSVYLANSRY